MPDRWKASSSLVADEIDNKTIYKVLHAEFTTNCPHVKVTVNGKKCHTAKQWWEETSRKDWPEKCQKCDPEDPEFGGDPSICDEDATLGAHVLATLGDDRKMWIIPCCSLHNNAHRLNTCGHEMWFQSGLEELLEDCTCDPNPGRTSETYNSEGRSGGQGGDGGEGYPCGGGGEGDQAAQGTEVEEGEGEEEEEQEVEQEEEEVEQEEVEEEEVEEEESEDE